MQTKKFSKRSDFFGQGSIFAINNIKFNSESGEVHTFSDYYPYVDLSDITYGILCTQDCDIENASVSHINIALLEPIQRTKKQNPINFLDESKFLYSFENMYLWSEDEFKDQIKNKVKALVQNSNQHHMFITIGKKYYFVNLTKVYPLKFANLEVVKSQVKRILTGSFKYHLGWKLASLYGRVGLPNYEAQALSDLTATITVLVAEAAKTKWPANSYSLPLSNLNKIKGDIKNYQALKASGRNSDDLIIKIYDRLVEFKVVKKTE